MFSCAFDDALCMVPRHPRFGEMRCCRRNGFLDIDQTKAFAVFLLFGDAQQNGKPQSAEGSVAFHPVGGIYDFLNVIRKNNIIELLQAVW